MFKAIRTLQRQLVAHIWQQKDAQPPDFVWLARFRLLTLYVIIKGFLLIAVGLIGIHYRMVFPLAAPALTLLFWTSIVLSVCASALLLFLGLGLASKRWSRPVGVVILLISDICMLMAILYAGIVNSLVLLLVVVVVISCTTPLLAERISRYAQHYERSKYQLQHIQRDLDALLLRHTEELTNAIASERSTLRREIHDKLLQDISAVLLQISVALMRNSVNGNVQLSAAEAAKLEASLRRVAAEARNVMQELKTPSVTLESRS